MRVWVVLNRTAGSVIAYGPERVEAIVRERFAACGHEVRSALVHAVAIETAVAEALHHHADVVVIGGGDGTIRTAAALLSGSNTALGVLPLGTMNLVARDLSIPLDLPTAVEALAHGAFGEIDLAEVNGQVFLCQSALGVVPQLTDARERYRGQPWYWRVPGITVDFLKILLRTRRFSMTLDRGLGEERVRAISLTVTNNSLEEAFGKLPRRTALTHGNLELMLIRSRSGVGFVWTSLMILLGRGKEHPEVEAHPLMDMVISNRSQSMRVSNDGEVIKLKGPLHYSIRPRGLRVLLPGSGQGDTRTAGSAAG